MDDVRIIRITDENIFYLKEFIENLAENSKKFRYYASRPFSFIKNHLVTVVFLKNEKPFAYGHLDKEKDKVWLGIALIPSYTGKGYGKKMMDVLINYANENDLKKINLSVDADNLKAISLYRKFGFIEKEKNTDKNILFFNLNLD
ncbi:MAG: hypothetical protein CMC14_04500 [Flavobacteriaceae bacterium]|nr:hypothetical protein [Flavobacteriaceae bacterium]